MANWLQSPLDLEERDPSRVILDRDATGGKVDLTRRDTLKLLQVPLDRGRAGRAVHPANTQLPGLGLRRAHRRPLPGDFGFRISDFGFGSGRSVPKSEI